MTNVYHILIIRLLEINGERNGHRKLPSILDGKSKPSGARININLIDNEDGSLLADSNKTKMKELSKVYKVNIGNIDELNERYQLITKKIQKRDKYKENYMVKNQSIQNNSNNYLDDGVNNLKILGKSENF